MSTESLPTGPDRDEMISLIRQTWPDAVVATTEGAMFFSLDEKHWPNFATVVWTDAHDMGNPADLARPGVYRVNIGLSREAFQRLVGSMTDPDYAALDTVLPHPVYAEQLWIGILNPSHGTVRDVVLPLIGEAHDRLGAQRKRQQQRRRAVGD